jgi:molybdopterin synthase sulfur carrier subunit
VKVNFYATFRPLVGSKDVDIPLRDGATLQELVAATIERFPALGPMLLNDAGEIARHIQLCVNGRSSLFLDEGLDTPLAPTDKIDIFPAVAGGAY